jgi:hypothetical protein
MNALFGTIRELCHGTPSGEATDALVEACEEAYDADPEYACEVVLPYVLPELAGWSDEVVFGEDTRKDSNEPYRSEIWETVGVRRNTLEWLVQDAFLHGLLRLEPDAFDYMYRLLARVAHTGQNNDPPMGRLDLDGETFCDRRWPLFGMERYSTGRVIEHHHRESTRPLRLVASMHMTRDEEDGVFDQRLEFIEERARSTQWHEVCRSMPQTVGGELQPHDGLWPNEIAFLEHRLGCSFPVLVQEYLRLFGRLCRLPRTDDFPINPYTWIHTSGPNQIVPVMVENQGGFWLVLHLDQPEEDPWIHETREVRRTEYLANITETLKGLRLPNDHEMAFESGRFSDVMSGGYMRWWDIPHIEDPEYRW